jgi:NADPH:quinone reductase-like Zn-dependent oxidoreductase
MIAKGALRSIMTATVCFDDLAGALQRVADRAVVGKVVMVVDA